MALMPSSMTCLPWATTSKRLPYRTESYRTLSYRSSFSFMPLPFPSIAQWKSEQSQFSVCTLPRLNNPANVETLKPQFEILPHIAHQRPRTARLSSRYGTRHAVSSPVSNIQPVSNILQYMGSSTQTSLSVGRGASDESNRRPRTIQRRPRATTRRPNNATEQSKVNSDNE